MQVTEGQPSDTTVLLIGDQAGAGLMCRYFSGRELWWHGKLAAYQNPCPSYGRSIWSPRSRAHRPS